MVQGPGQFLAAPADKGGRLLEGDPDRLRHHGAGLGRGQPFHHHPAGQDQRLGLGPAPGQTPGHQELIEAGFRFSGFRFSVFDFLLLVSGLVFSAGWTIITGLLYLDCQMIQIAK